MNNLVVMAGNHRFEFNETEDRWEGTPEAVCDLINRHFHDNASSAGADPDRNKSALSCLQKLYGKVEVEVLELPEKLLPSAAEDAVY